MSLTAATDLLGTISAPQQNVPLTWPEIILEGYGPVLTNVLKTLENRLQIFLKTDYVFEI